MNDLLVPAMSVVHQEILNICGMVLENGMGNSNIVRLTKRALRQVGFAPLKGVDSVLEYFPSNQFRLIPPTRR